MIFQIQENARAALRHLPHGLRARGSKELAADFEHADNVRQLVRKLQGSRQRIKIQSYD